MDTTRLIESKVERHVLYSGGAHPHAPHEPLTGTPEETRERHFEGQRRHYYDAVVESVLDAESILIFGPGEAKGELKARLEHAGLGARVAAARRLTS